MNHHTAYFWFMIGNGAPAQVAFENLVSEEIHEIHDYDAQFYINDLDWDDELVISKN